MPMNPRVRDFVLYAVIGVAYTGLIILSIMYLTDEQTEWVTKWGAFVTITAIIFGYTIKKRWRRLRRRRWFWAVIAGLLALHVTTYLVLFTFISDWKLGYYILPTGAETGLIYVLTGLLAVRLEQRRQRPVRGPRM